MKNQRFYAAESRAQTMFGYAEARERSDKIQLLTPHFALQEFIRSATARKHGIANNPPPEAVENLKLLCRHTLEPLREALGLPVVITSGYRCKALNNIIAHHSNRSQHMKGQAADFHVGQGEVSGSKFFQSLCFVKAPLRVERQVSGSKAAELLVPSSLQAKRPFGSSAKFQGSGSKAAELLVPSSLQAKRPCGTSVKVQGDSPRERLVRAFRLILTEPSIDFDQLIIYPNFIHVSYVSREKNRRCVMTGSGAGKYCALTREAAMRLA